MTKKSGKNRELLFSVTASDCDFQAFKGSGPGGQHRNKVATAIRCTHRDSGAVGVASDDKSQHRNKRVAFRRMAESKTFRDWANLEAAKKNGELKRIKDKVERLMSPLNIKVEVQQGGRWAIDEDGQEQ